MGCKKPHPLNRSDVLMVKEKYEKRLLSIANVAGIGIGYKTIHNASTNKLCLKIYVENKVPLAKLAKAQRIPKKFDSVETDVEEIGKIRPELMR